MKNKIARVYLRVSTNDQDLTRQEHIAQAARRSGYYIAGIYKEKASGARRDRPELNRMIDELQPNDVIIVESMDRLSRLPLPDAEKLIETIKAKGAKLAIPGVTDLNALVKDAKGSAKIVIDAIQDILLKLSLQMAREDYEQRRTRQRQGIELARKQRKFKGRQLTPADMVRHQKIIDLRLNRCSVNEVATLLNCSASQVNRVWANYKKEQQDNE